MKRSATTIAILGEAGDLPSALAQAVMQQDIRLLFISRNPENSSALSELSDVAASAEVEFHTCEKECCWEADIIVFTNLAEVEPVLVQRIKQVATQKIVVLITREGQETSEINRIDLQKLLPFSKLVELRQRGEKFDIFGRNREANLTVGRLFKVGHNDLKN